MMRVGERWELGLPPLTVGGKGVLEPGLLKDWSSHGERGLPKMLLINPC